ncbi:uncharacterized protein [Nicotiana sylvestris]|uniref:uncharacterized protein n=1 Tax=Nicotiana sylvestris TaxID=4096 RepID=UPI00388CD965
MVDVMIKKANDTLVPMILAEIYQALIIYRARGRFFQGCATTTLDTRTSLSPCELAKEASYRAKISKLEGQIRDLKFDNSVQAAADEGEKNKLAQENKALRDQIQKMRIATKNQERSQADERLISGLRKKVIERQNDLEKSEASLARARAQLTKNAEGWAEFVRMLKRKYEGKVTDLKRKLTTFENEIAKQAKNFKAEMEHCYELISQLEEDMQQLQSQNHHDTQVLEPRTQ